MKKLEYISFRTDAEVKAALEAIAVEKKWTMSFVVEQIIIAWLKEHKDDSSKL